MQLIASNEAVRKTGSHLWFSLGEEQRMSQLVKASEWTVNVNMGYTNTINTYCHVIGKLLSIVLLQFPLQSQSQKEFSLSAVDPQNI